MNLSEFWQDAIVPTLVEYIRIPAKSPHFDRDWQGAEHEYRRTIQCNPSYALGYHWYSNLLAARGQHDAAHIAIMNALEIDPVSIITLVWAGVTSYLARQFDEAIRLDPTADGIMLNLGLCNEKLGRFKTALYWFRKAQFRATETNLPDNERVAREHTTKLATQVATVKIAFAPAAPGAKVKIDGEVVQPDDYGHAEVDPGHHVLDAERKLWVVVVEIHRVPAPHIDRAHTEAHIACIEKLVQLCDVQLVLP